MAKWARLIAIVCIIIAVGILVTYVIPPLRAVWPWLMALPMGIRVAVILITLGAVTLFATTIAERIEQKRSEGDLSDDANRF